MSLAIITEPGQANAFGTIHGGVLLRLADECGAICALRHAGKGQITTAAIDSLTFLGPVFVGERVEIVAEVTYVGRTSIETRIDIYAEPFDRPERRKVAVGYGLVCGPRRGRPPTAARPSALDRDRGRPPAATSKARDRQAVRLAPGRRAGRRRPWARASRGRALRRIGRRSAYRSCGTSPAGYSICGDRGRILDAGSGRTRRTELDAVPGSSNFGTEASE